jgi:hypothetical protein
MDALGTVVFALCGIIFHLLRSDLALTRTTQDQHAILIANHETALRLAGWLK